jgi:ATP synthase protein I
MARPLNKIIQNEAYRLVYLQLLAVLSISALFWLFSGQKIGCSVLTGGMAYGVPNLLFVWHVFRYAGAKQMTQFMTAFFYGEMLKLILSGLLFLLVVKYLPTSLLFVLIGLIAAMMSFWTVCLFCFSKHKGVTG